MNQNLFQNHKILIVGRNSESTKYIYTSISNWNGQSNTNLIYEKQPILKDKIRRIIKHNGFLRGTDIIIFILLGRIISKFYTNRRKCIYGINEQKDLKKLVTTINTVNSKKFVDLVIKYDPEFILLSGCRILSFKTLESLVDYEILNIHAGITPYFRGVHGAYWSLVQNETPGVTLHRVDQGIDTGEIINQTYIKINQKDSFWTYPALQVKIGMNLFKDYVLKKKGGKKIVLNKESKQFRHPQLSTYLKNLILKKVK